MDFINSESSWWLKYTHMARVFFQICSIAPYNGKSTFHHEVPGCYVPVCKSKHRNMG